MSDTLTFTGTLVVVTCWCGTQHAIPEGMRNYQLHQHDDGKDYFVYCPHGHTHAPAGDGKAAKLARRLAAEQERRALVAAERDQAKASARAQKGAATKARKKAAAAVCPVPGCGRSFVQLRRHMASKHPDYDPAEVSS